MVLKVAVGAGHGGFGVTPGKRTPDGEYEWDFNDANVDAFIDELSQYEDVLIKLVSDPTGRRDVPLRERVDIANDWGANIYFSFHHNALIGKWHNGGGTETFSYPGSSGGKALARIAHSGALDAYGLNNRGLKTMAFYILRYSKMPAALIEGGFMDSRVDIKVMRNDKKLAELGVKVAREVAKKYSLKRSASAKKVTKETAASGALYRVQIGAFEKRHNAQDLSSEIRKKGFDTYVVKVGKWYKVQVGAFANKKNAQNQLDRVKKAGYKDAFITTDVTESIPALEPLNDPEDFNLVVDGYLGPHVVKALQSYFDLIEDGEMWGQYSGNQAVKAFNQKAVRYGVGGSPVVRALQKKIGATADGIWGVDTTRALQRYLGTPVDGIISRPSTAIKELQRRLNNGTF